MISLFLLSLNIPLNLPDLFRLPLFDGLEPAIYRFVFLLKPSNNVPGATQV